MKTEKPQRIVRISLLEVLIIIAIVGILIAIVADNFIK